MPGIICWGRRQFEDSRPNQHLDIPEAGIRKEDKRIHIHEQPRLELQNLLHKMGGESGGGREPLYVQVVVVQVGEG